MSSNLPVRKVSALTEMIDAQAENLSALLPADFSLDEMRANIIAAVGANPDLIQKCSRSSLMQSIFEACELGLMVHSSLGEAWIVPYKNRATFIPGYQGLTKLAYNAGFTKRIESRAVHSNDRFEIVYGLNPVLRLEENHANRGDLVGVYCLCELMTGGSIFEYFTVEQLEKIRQMSAAPNSPAWKNHTVEMYRKTVWRNLSKWIPRSGKRYARALEISDREYETDWGYRPEAQAQLEEYLDKQVQITVPDRPEDAPGDGGVDIPVSEEMQAESESVAMPSEFEQDAEAQPEAETKEDNSKQALQFELASLFGVDQGRFSDDMLEFVQLVLENDRPYSGTNIWQMPPKDRKKILSAIKRIGTRLPVAGALDYARARQFALYCIKDNLSLARHADIDAWAKDFRDSENEDKST